MGEAQAGPCLYFKPIFLELALSSLNSHIPHFGLTLGLLSTPSSSPSEKGGRVEKKEHLLYATYHAAFFRNFSAAMRGGNDDLCFIDEEVGIWKLFFDFTYVW